MLIYLCGNWVNLDKISHILPGCHNLLTVVAKCRRQWSFCRCDVADKITLVALVKTDAERRNVTKAASSVARHPSAPPSLITITAIASCSPSTFSGRTPWKALFLVTWHRNNNRRSWFFQVHFLFSLCLIWSGIIIILKHTEQCIVGILVNIYMGRWLGTLPGITPKVPISHALSVIHILGPHGFAWIMFPIITFINYFRLIYSAVQCLSVIQTIIVTNSPCCHSDNYNSPEKFKF